jgi:hypothetical protein
MGATGKERERDIYIDDVPLDYFIVNILFLCPTVVLIWKPIFSIFFLRNNALSENVV